MNENLGTYFFYDKQNGEVCNLKFLLTNSLYEGSGDKNDRPSNIVAGHPV